MIAAGKPVLRRGQYVFFDGADTAIAQITADGLPARFATFEIPDVPLATPVRSKNNSNCTNIAKHYYYCCFTTIATYIPLPIEPPLPSNHHHYIPSH